MNMAMTADGKIATANRVVSSFGSRRDQEHLYELRATADAVMAGARTADLNAVHLGPGALKYRRLRQRRGLAEFNLRIIVSRTGSVNPAARIFQHTFSPILVLTTQRAPARRRTRLRALGAEVRVCGAKEINFPAALRWLRRQWGIKRLLCEGGGELADALFRAGAFQGEKASDAYFVRCALGDTMTQDDIDRGQVIIIVGFAPLKPAEFVIVRIQQKTQQ
ncbi:MAG TPA: dihydrofolate reductase family protein [Verrucomicrobiota bacterium]|nr:dihydrofolate reductase family protein [Verrucomicrobiota bacterium]